VKVARIQKEVDGERQLESRQTTDLTYTVL